MKFSWLHAIPTVALTFLLGLGCSGIAPALHGQTPISGDIAGTVLDATGAAVAGASITAICRETGARETTASSSSGGYRFSLLMPGSYTLSASADGFKASSVTVTVAVGQIVAQNITLMVGAASETVRVSPTPQLLQTDTAQFSTNLSFNEIQNIPNPGSDITYQAQAKPGVVMNTGSSSAGTVVGYGNFSVFGLPGVSNTFTMNGMDVNDSFMNLNYSGPSNLLLGLNDIQESNVVANAYAAEYGGSGGLQLNSISRAGGNRFHGNLTYAWNGSTLNGNDWFFNREDVSRPFSNFNQWAGAVGGPIERNKLFFFVNTEGISFITSSQSYVNFPSATFESDPSFSTSRRVSVLGDTGNCPGDGSSSLENAGNGGECSFYQHIFNLYNNAPTYKLATPTQTPGQLEFAAPSKFALTEKIITARLDANLAANDKAFGHFKYDHGLQPSYTDPINSAFDAQSDQSDFEGQFAETHTFGARAVNQFLMTGSWYTAIYANVNPSTELSTFPFEMFWYDGFASNLNNEAELWPDGRNVTQYQVADDFSYTAGKHALKAGFAFRKNDISDHDPGVLTTPVVYVDAANFSAGVSDLAAGDFPTRLSVPLALYSLDFYVQDNWKPLENLTVIPGLRVERNSNVVCRANCMSSFGGNIFTLAESAPLNSASGPYNQQIKSDLEDAFNSYQPLMVEPRLGFTYSPDTKTVVRGGFGMFTDAFPAYTVDSILSNPPLTLAFTLYGKPFNGPFNMALDPSDP
ncbi:MAG: carboxypeptidase regulatory-like domain-containing protein, partial [Acidobacteriota bacterium]